MPGLDIDTCGSSEASARLDQACLTGIVFVLRSGMAWRMLRPDLGWRS